MVIHDVLDVPIREVLPLAVVECALNLVMYLLYMLAEIVLAFRDGRAVRTREGLWILIVLGLEVPVEVVGSGVPLSAVVANMLPFGCAAWGLAVWKGVS